MPSQRIKLGNEYTQTNKKDSNNAIIKKAKKKLPCKDHMTSKTKFI